MIINASPLIIFGKLKRTDLLIQLFQQIDIVQEVYREVVVQGESFPDGRFIQNLIDRGMVRINTLGKEYCEVAEKLSKEYAIDIGESATIALALQRGEKEVIIDEIAARFAAEANAIKPFGSLRVLALAFKNNLITKSQVEEMVNQMLQSKYRMSASVLLAFWKGIEEIHKKQHTR